MKKIFVSLFFVFQLNAVIPTSDSLIVVHTVTTAEMNAIVTPPEGSLLFNSDDNEIYEYNATQWKRISSTGSETKIIAGNGITVTGTGTIVDPYLISLKTPYDCNTGAQVFSSCNVVVPNVDGEYCIDSDGVGGNGPYKVFCDMTIDGGGWSRVVRTTGNNHQFGQLTDTINYALVTDTTGVYLTYDRIKNFNQIMIKKVGTVDFASYNLVTPVVGSSIFDLMTFVKNQPMQIQNDTAFDGVRVQGLTSEYSGIKVAGTLNYNYFFMAGINESFDNDQAYMSFSDSTGSVNAWGDNWRGTNQAGTLWSFLNGDYYTSTNYHIGNGYSQAGAGFKGANNGTYEIYIK